MPSYDHRKIHQHVKLVLALVLNFLLILKLNLDLVNLNVDNKTTELDLFHLKHIPKVTF